MPFSNKKILITGGAGFIGVNAAFYFAKKNAQIIIIDNLSRKGTSENLNWIKNNYNNILFYNTDIRNYSELENIITKHTDIDMIIHLAGQVAVTTSVTNPREDFEINAIGSFNILEAVRNNSIKPFMILSSTNKVYGNIKDVKIIEKNNTYCYKDLKYGISEENNIDFHSPYGCSKGCADQYFRDYYRIYDIPTIVFRQSCIYGFRQFGIEDQGWVAWFTIASILNKKITIYGDGKQVRDVLFIEDLLKAYESAFNNKDKVKGQIFNIGGGNNFQLSLLELIAFLEKYLNKKIDLKFSNWRPGDQLVYVSDISKIHKILNWKPEISPETGVKKLTNWVNENIDTLKRFF